MKNPFSVSAVKTGSSENTTTKINLDKRKICEEMCRTDIQITKNEERKVGRRVYEKGFFI